METIGQRLRAARESQGYSVRELRQLLVAYEAENDLADGAVQAAAISKFENGDRRPRVDHVLAVCEETDTNPYWVLTGQGPKSWSAVEQADYDAGRRDLANELRKWLAEEAPEKEEEGGEDLATGQVSQD